ncbi:MAG TPA: ABC transporter ATP-binding protein [Aliidongia sp.]|nr:ABC transporter ATP-binding protein [Aliidongia sp.]
MIGLQIEAASKRFGSFLAVDNVSLSVPLGQFVCFLGPSGCGKTTLLRLIAGLDLPSSGRILLNGKDITRMPAHERRFGMVFQSLALFPHLNVEDNIAYSLRLRHMSAPDRRARVQELLHLIRLPDIGKRAIGQLSGGQRQRVAIARALAQEPSVFLLDEPLSALDAKLREEMQVELRLLQQQLKITTILVTHDQREAMTMADIIIVMAHGKVQQMGTPTEIYRNPANRFVASFFGLSNLIEAEIAGAGALRLAGEHMLDMPGMPAGLAAGKSVTLSVRPEDVRLAAAAPGEWGLPGEVTFVRDMGASIEAHIDCLGGRIISVMPPRDWIGVGAHDRVMVQLPPDSCRVLPE